jgi:3-mercaptopyruvate sulfurtransferase SseA
VAQVFRERGWRNVFALEGGMEAWEDAGYETEPKGAEAIRPGYVT